jgi:hypothetical protein
MKSFFCLLGFIFICVSAVFPQEVSPTDIPQLEKTVTGLLSPQYPGYSVMRLSDTGQSLQKYFMKEHPKENPGLVFGNFRHPSVTDCAALLVDSNKPKSGIKLLVLVLGMNTNHPEVKIIQDFRKEESPTLDVYLLYEPRGTIPDVNKDNWVDMTSAGFSLNPFDRGGERVFYWQGETLQAVWVSD